LVSIEDHQQALPPSLDELDRRILTDIQVDFPIVRWPYEVVAARMGCTSAEVLERVVRLSEAGVIRRLGGVFSAARLGYVSTLVAAKVAPASLEAVAAEVSRLEGVTHNYARQHAYNLWFTVTARSAEALRQTVDVLRTLAGVEDMKNLPGALSYKTSAVFAMNGESGQAASTDGKHSERLPAGSTSVSPVPQSPAANPVPKPPPAAAVSLDERQKHLVRLVQESLPLDSRPLVSLARQWGGPVELLIVTLRHWLATGVLRRFGAVLAHRRVGLSASALAMFRVSPARADAAGAILAARSEVSHCYLRETPDGWPWNLFAMFHGRGRESVIALVRRLAEEAGLGEHEVVFSTVEYKKTSPRFFLEGS
jgi:DNA-binding Lrp family transcriptional regulator